MRWEDPPESRWPAGRAHYRWDDTRQELQANPGKWALIEEDVPTYRKSNFHNLFRRKDGYQVCSRYTKDRNTISIWIRYVGTEGLHERG